MKYVRDNIVAMEGYVPGEQPRDRRYVKLNTNENPYPPSPEVVKTIAGFAADHLRLYPDPLSTAIRKEAALRADLPGPEWVIAGNGSDDLLTMGVRTFVNQGAVLASFDPSYSLYPILADIQGAQCRMIPLEEDFSMPADAAQQAGSASLLFVVRPNAPTGNAFALEEMRSLCRDFQGIVWIDEAYAEFADDNCLSLVEEFANAVVSRTLSKSYSLAGIRLGLGYANPEIISQLMKVKDSYNVDMLTQAAGLAALRDPEYVARTVARIRGTRTSVSADLQSMGFEVLPSQSNFIFCRPPMEACEYFKALRQAGILVRYFSSARTRQYVRITIGREEEMEALLEATREILAGVG